MNRLKAFLQSSILSWVAILLITFSAFIPNIIRYPLFALVLVYEGLKWYARKNGLHLNKVLQDVVIATLVVFVLGAGFFEVRFRFLVNNINHTEQELSVDFVVLKDSNVDSFEAMEGITIGLLSDENSYIGHVAPLEILKDEKIAVKQKIYPGYAELILGLIHHETDVIALPTGYSSTFSSIDELVDVLGQLETVVTSTYTQKVEVPVSNTDVLNIVLIGGDNPIVSKSTAGFNYDVIVVYSLNFKTHESVMLSIPRDSYIYTTCSSKKDKITHSGWQGADCLTSTLSQFLGIELSQYMLVDFKGLINLVDSIGGIWIDVPQAIDEQDENRNFDNMIHIDPGYQLLDGQHALAFLRHRHTLENGAITRSENHEKFLVAIMQQLAKPTSLLKIPSLFKALETSVLTNIASKDIYTYYQNAVSLLSTNGIDSLLPRPVSLTGHGAMIYTPSFGHDLYYYVLDEDSVKFVQEAFQAIQ